jgi:hypothetical protein
MVCRVKIYPSPSLTRLILDSGNLLPRQTNSMVPLTEFLRICQAVGMGFAALGALGFIVKVRC